MGVNLSELVPVEQTEFESLGGRKIAIDAYNTLYQFLSIIRDRFTGEPLRNSKGQVTSHLSGLFYRTSRMLEAGITPVFVFDGKPPEFKLRTIEARKHIRAEAEAKWKEALKAGNAEKVRMYAQGATRLTGEMVEQSKRLLELMGVSWVQAPSEGEAQAAHFMRKGLVWAVGSQDWDSLLFGAQRLVRNLTLSGRKKVPRREKYVTVKPEIVELDKVLKSTGLTHDQLIILGILVGTDYNPGGVKGVGPKTALKLVREKKILDKVLEGLKWDFETPPEDIFEFFRKPPAEDLDIPKFSPRPDKVRSMLVDEFDFSEERIDSILKKAGGAQESKKQANLQKFFG
jgi:flap endonuclease-1